MITWCYTCTNKATHRIYENLLPVCNTHLVEAVNEEQGDIQVVSIDAVVDAIETPIQRTLNDARIEEIKLELDLIKARKGALNELISALITSTNPMVSVFEVQEKYSNKQDELFKEWKKLSEENYQTFQKWVDGLGVK